MCASTLCPLSSSTRKRAFASASVTVPSTSITPSFFAMPPQSLAPAVRQLSSAFSGPAHRIAASEHGGQRGRRRSAPCWCRTSELIQARSEEHTSELQSRGHLVCRLLLEKKKIR